MVTRSVGRAAPLSTQTSSRHPALRPFAGVVEQIADHFLEVLALAEKAQTRIGAAGKDHALVAVDFAEGAQQGLDRRRNLRRGAERAAARRRPRPVEIKGDLVAHDLRLLLNFLGERPRRGVGLVDDDAERRLQRMGEIADLRARAFENVAIGADQQIELFGERRDFARVGAMMRSRSPRRIDASSRCNCRSGRRPKRT